VTVSLSTAPRLRMRVGKRTCGVGGRYRRPLISPCVHVHTGIK